MLYPSVYVFFLQIERISRSSRTYLKSISGTFTEFYQVAAFIVYILFYTVYVCVNIVIAAILFKIPCCSTLYLTCLCQAVVIVEFTCKEVFVLIAAIQQIKT